MSADASPGPSAPGGGASPASSSSLRRHTGLGLFLRATWARGYVRIIGVNRDLTWVLHETLLPLVGALAYVYIYRALGAPARFEGMALLGMAMATYWHAVLWGMAAQFYWEKEMGNLELYLLSPIDRMAILAGMALGSMFTSTARFLCIVLAGSLILGVRYHVEAPVMLALTFLLSLTALYALGMLAASVFFMYGRSAWQLFGFIQEPVFLAAGFFFPMRPLVGRWAILLATIVPLGLGLDAMRQCMLAITPEEALLPVWVEAIALAALAGLFLVLARKALAHMETLAKREGKLTLKWQ